MRKVFGILLTFLVLITFAACGSGENNIGSGNNTGNITYFEDDYVPKYNDAFYDSAADWIREDFQSENAVRVTGFIDDNPETRLPDTRTFIVTDREQFEDIFVDNVAELEADFDSQMIIIYTFGIEYVLPAFILDMNVSGDTLTVDYTIPTYQGAGSAAQPFQRWFVIKLDKSEITSAEFNEHSTYYKN